MLEKPAVKNINKLIILLLLLFLIFRIIYVLFLGVYSEKDLMLGDGYGYSEFAIQFLSGDNWFTNLISFPGDHREPVYPLFLAIVYFIFGIKNYFAVYIIQSLISALMIFYIYKISELLFGNNKAAVLALVWSGFYFIYLRYSGELLRETLVFFLIIYFIYYFIRFSLKKDFKIKYLTFLSFLYAVLIHLDGRYIFYSPFLFILFFINNHFWSSIKHYLLFGCIVVLFTLPWTIRNYIAYGDVIIISKFTLNLTGNMVGERGEHFNFHDIDSVYSTPAFDCNENYPTIEERDKIKSGLNPNNRSKYEVNLIKKDVYPAKSYFERKIYFLKKMWLPFDFEYNYSPYPWALFETPYSLKHNIISIIGYGIMLPFFLFGIFYSISKKNKYICFILLPVVVHLVLHIIMHGLERYRHPIDSFIIIGGSFGMIVLFDLLLSNLKHKK